jgi:Cellulase (glycosyl hydrolase family 5)
MTGAGTDDRWTPEHAAEWQRRTGWLAGCNYTPAYAANQIEMWSREMFDPAAIGRELGDAQGLGFNALRVYLHDLAYAADPRGMLERVERFLDLAGSHGLGVAPVIFDSVWHPFPQSDRQPEPRPGVHNSGWVQSPGVAVLRDPARFAGLEGYVRALVERFGRDERVLFWDLWNEPDNANAQAYGALDLGADKGWIVRPLLEQAFAWARAAAPIQPLSSGLWAGSWDEASLTPLQRMQVERSDIVTFHCYDDAASMAGRIASLRRFSRPLVCTEYMARSRGSTFAAILPLLAREGVGAIGWGLHRGRTQTHLAWNTWEAPCLGEPEVWFHDVLWSDGRPYRAEEVELIRRVARA